MKGLSKANQLVTFADVKFGERLVAPANNGLSRNCLTAVGQTSKLAVQFTSHRVGHLEEEELMPAPRIRDLIRSFALLVVAISFAAVAKPVAAEFATVDISSQYTTDLRSILGGSQFPVAPTTISVGGVPFDLKPLANTADSLGIVVSPLGPYSLSFPVNQPNAVAVYTLINSAFGSFGSNNGLVEAIGTGGAYASFDLIQGTNIRDYVQNVFNNVVGPDIQSAVYGSVRLDRQVLSLPASFQGQTLTEIRITGTAGNPSGEPFVAAITLEVPEPSAFVLAGLGLGVLVVGWARRK